MQILLSLPEHNSQNEVHPMTGVCGVSLLARVIATATRAGADSALVLHRSSLTKSEMAAIAAAAHIAGIPIKTAEDPEPFFPDKPASWKRVAARLKDRVVWIPWNFVANKAVLADLFAVGEQAEYGSRVCSVCRGSSEESPMVVAAHSAALLNPQVSVYDMLDEFPAIVGMQIDSAEALRFAERRIVRGSGKPTDGIYSQFNRRLVWPLVRWISKTPVTANAVTFAGIPLAFAAGYFFLDGTWAAMVIGALLYFANVLTDEVDGMLARIKFQESAFGCWLETAADYLSYIPLFGGMTIGVARQHGSHWLWVGAALVVGTLLLFAVLVQQRKAATIGRSPTEYASRYNRLLEQDAGNVISRLVRKLNFLLKKGVMAHYVVLFAVLGGIPLFLAIGAFGANAAWIVSIYNNRLFRSGSKKVAANASGMAQPIV